jgi:DNA recombination protein RmuC
MTEIIISLVIGIVIGVVLTLLLTKKKGESDINLDNAIRNLATEALRTNNEEFIKLAKTNLETVLEKTKNEFGKQAIAETLKPLQDKIETYDKEIKRIEEQRNQQYGGIKSQVESLVKTTNQLDKETVALVNTLKRPEARGHLGEITLRRVVELSGLEKHFSFAEQSSVEGESRLRPDMIIELPNHGKIVIDSKVTLKPLLDAYEEHDIDRKTALIGEYKKAVKAHVRNLAGKEYWKQFAQSPEFVVMFLPGESFYFEAVRQEPELVEKAIEDNVIIVTPATLIALLRTVAMGWQQHDISENAKTIAAMGAELYERICKFSQFFVEIGKRLNKAVNYYNEGVGSFTSRVMPSAIRLKDLSCPATRENITEPPQIDTGIRELPKEE